MEFTVIGEVKSHFKEPHSPEEMRDKESILVIDPEYDEGLYTIEENDFLQVLFYLHQSKSYDLKAPRHHGKVRGVFASRSPRRPTPIGLSTVELLERNDNNLRVRGLDAIDGTPILDLKPYAESMDNPADNPS